MKKIKQKVFMLKANGEAVRSWTGRTSSAVKRQNQPLGFPP